MTERQPQPDGPEDPKSPPANPEQAASEPIPESSDSIPDELALFDTGPGPRLFGEGSYAEGGSNEEGNFLARTANPHGSIGSFDDAGGPGSTQLLGQRHSHEAAQRSRQANDEKTGPDEPVEDS
jgi:hypothetical protein